jgi:hypothetical protein
MENIDCRWELFLGNAVDPIALAELTQASCGAWSSRNILGGPQAIKFLEPLV